MNQNHFARKYAECNEALERRDLENLIVYIEGLFYRCNYNHGSSDMCSDLNDDEILKAFSESSDEESDIRELCLNHEEGRYTAGSIAGEGGAKKVYKSSDRVTGRILARAFPKHVDSRSCKDFVREARLHSLLEHPNIIPLYDIGYEDDRPYFSMKYVHGRTVEESVKSLSPQEFNKPERPNEILDIFLKVCDAVAFAHSKGVLHLDLKPANIHLSDYGEVLVGDWGLARTEGVFTPDSDDVATIDYGQYTQHGMLAGTPGFMAPEQTEKGIKKGPYTDIYSLGCVLLYLFTGKEAVTGEPMVKVEKTLRGELSYTDELIPVGLRPVIKRALELPVENRYQLVQDLINDINAFRSGYLTSAEIPSFSRQLVTLYQRNKTELRILFGAVVLMIALTSLFITRIKKEEKISRETLVRYHQTEQDRKETAEKAYKQFLKESYSRYVGEGEDRGEFNYKPSDDIKAYHLVNQALKFDDNLQAWGLKGKLAMLIGEFDVAVHSFTKAGGKYDTFREICLKYKEVDLRNLSILIELIYDVQKLGKPRMVNNFIFKTMFSDLTLKDRIYFTEETLKLKNTKQQLFNFKFDIETFALDISDNPDAYTIYMLKNLPLRELNLSNGGFIVHDFIHLRNMPLVKLDVSDTRFTDDSFKYIRGKKIRELSLRNCKVANLQSLTTMPLEVLDISGTTCKEFDFLKKLTKLKQLTCSKTQESPIRAVIGNRSIKLIIK